jgi:hypothetical protein
MPKSQGKSDPQNTKETPPKRDSKNLKAGGIFGSVRCLWDYLEGIAEKRWESLITKLNKIYLKLDKLYKSLMVTLLSFSAISIIMILFLKLIEAIPIIKIFIIIIASILAILAIIFMIILAIMSYIESIKYAIYHIIPILGLRGLVRILPALINELKGKLPKDVEKDAQKYIKNKKYQCMKRFRGNATKALSRIGRSIFFLMWINLILLSLLILLIFLTSFLVIDLIPIILPILHYLLGLKIPSISITSIESTIIKAVVAVFVNIERAVTKAVVEIVLWVLGVALSIIIGLSLFSSQARFDANTLHFVYDVKFTVLEWFVFAVFLIIISLIIISVKIPPIIAIIITVPALITFIALIISIIVYIILASATIDYMQLPRNNQGEN